MQQSLLIIDGHPDPADARFCHALADAYREGAERAGHLVRQIKLSEISFPLLRSKQEFDSGQVPPDILEAQEAIRWCNHMVIVYPLWLGTMPAMLKGFLEQVFRPEFAFDRQSQGWSQGNLSGRSARVVITMGMPAFAYRWFYGAHSLKSLERNVLKFAGIKPVRESIYGMVDSVSDAKRVSWISAMRILGRDAR